MSGVLVECLWKISGDFGYISLHNGMYVFVGQTTFLVVKA